MASIDELNKIIRYRELVENGDLDICDLCEEIRKSVEEAIRIEEWNMELFPEDFRDETSFEE